MAEISNVLKCPNCDGALEEDECYDLSISKGRAYALYSGHCVNCGEEVRWDTIYKFSHYENVVTMQRLPAP